MQANTLALGRKKGVEGGLKYPANNDFLLVGQFSDTGALYTCRPDLVGFVYGLPLLVIELKKQDVPARGVRREPD